MDEEPTKEQVYSCSYCVKEFKTLMLFNRHKKIHNLTCDKCRKTFKTFSQLRLHNKEKHPKLKFYKCKVCPDLTFNEEKDYLLHLRNDHEGKIIESHMCNVCGKTFRTSSELSLHIRSKCGTEKQFICKECGQKLMSPGSLYTHLKRHKGENSFMCRFCAKLFLTSGQLKVHERIHTQQKVFVCDVCGKGFCHRQSLITHISVHTGIKPYQCEGCGKSFSCVGNLLKHRRTHSDTCGALPMTSHRVQNPSTKIKVRINTPASSKLKRIQMMKDLERKFAVLEKDDMEECKTGDSETNGERECNNVELAIDKSCKEDDSDCNGSDRCSDVSDKCEESSCNNEDLRGSSRRNKRAILIHEEEFEEFVKIRKLNKGKTATCKYCEKEYSNFKWLFKHEQDHKENDAKDGFLLPYKCSVCKMGFETEFDLKEHQRNKHSTELSTSWTSCLRNGLPEPEKRDIIKRSSLPEFIKKFSLQLPDSSTVLGTIQKQICCGLSALDTFLHKISERDETPRDISDILDSAKIFADLYYVVSSCSMCSRLFSSSKTLRSHRKRAHQGIKRKQYLYICDKCGSMFKQKIHLVHHESSNCHPRFKCPICPKEFLSEYSRKAHSASHGGATSYRCGWCGKSYKWKGQLKVHLNAHAARKPYACEFCGKTFVYRSSLSTHRSAHVGKKFFCECCGSRFSCAGNLLRHKAARAGTCGRWCEENLSESKAAKCEALKM
ncbi:unnamed protein product [Phyllotreta striolata]|uniref:C2H2-type domain-containing protein n=1 Tax=Phyllotreta striolata TaxID=444603 RepID=A0A9N9THF6_PHYSR|nr:unnamed protein product [Phyllotreta striolata]